VTLRARSWLGSGLAAGGVLAAAAGWVLGRGVWIAAGLLAAAAGGAVLAAAVRTLARHFGARAVGTEEALRREIERIRE
jgi:class 3 adenylate cyclase